ncbi:MAG: NifU family protein [Thermoplasmata archaeon]|nr:NifU family protein [Thermoplasmata archaeon]
MLKEKVEEIIAEIRPMLQVDGGDIEVVDVDEEKGIAKVRLTGTCHGCPYAQITIKNGVERYLKEKIPEIKSVETV